MLRRHGGDQEGVIHLEAVVADNAAPLITRGAARRSAARGHRSRSRARARDRRFCHRPMKHARPLLCRFHKYEGPALYDAPVPQGRGARPAAAARPFVNRALWCAGMAAVSSSPSFLCSLQALPRRSGGRCRSSGRWPGAPGEQRHRHRRPDPQAPRSRQERRWQRPCLVAVLRTERKGGWDKQRSQR